jgi:hypothetical protein
MKNKEFNIFKREALHLIEKLEELIETMPNMGNTCEDSQKVCLVVTLHKLEQMVNGVSTDDFNDVIKESKFDKVLNFDGFLSEGRTPVSDEVIRLHINQFSVSDDPYDVAVEIGSQYGWSQNDIEKAEKLIRKNYIK